MRREHHQSSPERPTLIIGATGKIRRRVASQLQALRRPIRIQRASGRPPKDFSAFAREVAITEIWRNVV